MQSLGVGQEGHCFWLGFEKHVLCIWTAIEAIMRNMSKRFSSIHKDDLGTTKHIPRLWIYLVGCHACAFFCSHYNDVTMSVMEFQIIGVSIVCSAVCSGADQREHQSFASLAFVKGIHRWPVDSPHKGSVTRKMFPFNDVQREQC